jgi:hypothetical protein
MGFCATVTAGIFRVKSSILVMGCSLICSPLIATTEIGTSCIDSERACAVTLTSSSIWAPAKAAWLDSTPAATRLSEPFSVFFFLIIIDITSYPV